MLPPLTKEELDQYIALQDRVYRYAESIAKIYSGMSRWENVDSVRIENGTVAVGTTYWFPADLLTKTLDEIRGIRAAEEKSVADQKEIKEYQEYLRLKEKFEK